MLNRYIRNLLIIIVMIIVGSCDDNHIESNFHHDREKFIELKVKIADSGIHQSRASEEPGNKFDDRLNENKINNLLVYFFTQDGKKFESDENVTINALPNGLGKQILIRLSPEKAAEFKGKRLKVMVIANVDESLIGSFSTISELESSILSTRLISNSSPQNSFVMDGYLESTGSIEWPGGQNIYSVANVVNLKRAAAKIRLFIDKIDVKSNENGETVSYKLVGQPEVRLVHYVNRTSLTERGTAPSSDDIWADTEYYSMSTNAGERYEKLNTYAADIPFYSYENDWRTANENETFLLVKLKLKAGDGEPRAYYYRIPVNYQLPLPYMSEEEKQRIGTIQRNNIYDVTSRISILGSETESLPLQISSNIAVIPWKTEYINANIQKLHYLAVSDKYPIMPNVSSKSINYESDLPVETTIDEAYYYVYDYFGNQRKMIIDKSTVSVIAGDNTLLIQYNVQADLFVPVYINFTVKQVPDGDSSVPLFEKVYATQYPPKYVTASKSKGFAAGTAGTKKGLNDLYADFRFHDPLGVIAPYAKTGVVGPQTNEQLFRITTLVNVSGEKIGDPTGGAVDGRTKNDYQHNRLVSPEFIVASQHGLLNPVPQIQKGNGIVGWGSDTFATGYGPYSFRYPKEMPYSNNLYIYNAYTDYSSAEERCSTYFEDEYGADGWYTEHYIDNYGSFQKREIYKTFKYNGHWRIPTAAELKYIDGLQDNPKSAVKYLLWGKYYWTAEIGKAYNLNTNSEEAGANQFAENYVRCVFDTYKFKDK